MTLQEETARNKKLRLALKALRLSSKKILTLFNYIAKDGNGYKKKKPTTSKTKNF